MIKSTATAVFISLMSASAFADWTLDNEQSTVSFVSVKKGTVMESHHFKTLTGHVSDVGKFSLNIDLSSVDTSIAIRDQRMNEHLFETAKFSQATISGLVPSSLLSSLKANNTTKTTLSSQLSLHGQTVPVTLVVSVTKLTDGSLLVASVKPVIIKATDFDLVKGIEKLRQLAGLPSISTTVPVSFVLRLNT